MHSAPVTVMGPSAISAAAASSITMRWSPRASAVKPPRRRTGPNTVSVSPSGLTSVFAPSWSSSSCVASSRSHSFRRRRLTPVRVEDAARLRAGQRQNGREVGNVGAIDTGGHQPGMRRTGGVPFAARLKDAKAHLLQHIHDACVALQAVAAQVGQHHAAAHGVHAQKHRRLRPVARYDDAFRRGRAGGREAEYAFLLFGERNPKALHQAQRHIQIGPADRWGR